MSDECDRLLEQLDHYLHGELDTGAKQALQAHLDDCPPCLEGADFRDGSSYTAIAFGCCRRAAMRPSLIAR